MGYALFASRKQVLDARLNGTQLQLTQRDDEQFCLATQQTSLKTNLASLNAAQAGDLADLYGKLAETSQSEQRAAIDSQIKQKEQYFKQESDKINREIYEISMKEQSIELEKKRLETVVTALQQQMQTLEQAEGQAIERATPKFGGLG